MSPPTPQPQPPSIPPEPRNLSLLSLPLTYALSFPPHLYYVAHAMHASNYTYTNALPRTNLETLRSILPSTTWSSLVRARGAHLNALECWPVFAVGILAGNHANLPARDLNFAAASYIASRVVYTALYMGTTGEAMSYLRTGAFAWSVGVPLWVLWRAGVKVRDGDGGRV